MFKRTGRVTVFRTKALQPKKLPKPLVAVFVLAQLFSGINFGFFAAVSSKRLRTLANILSALNGLLLVTSYLYKFSDWDYQFPGFAAEYFFVFITMRFSKYTMFNFLTDLMAIDVKYNNVELNSRFGLTTSICVLFACCYKIATSSFYCIYMRCFNNGPIYFIMHVFYEMRHLIFIILATVHITVYYFIYTRVKFIKAAFGQRELETKQVAMFYKALSVNFKKINVWWDTLIVVGFMTDFIKTLGLFWLILKILKNTSLFPALFAFSVDIILLLLLICLPPVIAQMISAQIDEVKLLMRNRLLSRSNGFDEDLPRLLRYVKARPLVRAAWRLVPVDLRLPVSLFSMTATYLVVLVQITHLY